MNKLHFCYKRILLLMILGTVTMMMYACGKKKEPANIENAVNISYLNKEHTSLVTSQFIPESTDTAGIIEDVIVKLGHPSESIDMISPLALGTTIQAVYLDGTHATLSMDSQYAGLSQTDEILIRAALVRTFTQINGIDNISININDNPLLDRYGNPVGNLTADMFLDNEGQEINSYEERNIRLYFASTDGTHLVPVVKSVRYNTNNSLEKMIVDELIKGPLNADSKATINKNTVVNSVTVADGICYVDMSEDFLQTPEDISSQLTVYSLVNSLAEVSNINKVHILINGSSDAVMSDNMDISSIFERNLDIVVEVSEHEE